MNPELEKLHPYPFEKLAALKQGKTPPASLKHIALSMGEPKHATPDLIKDALVANLNKLSNYPSTRGERALRETIASWLCNRFTIDKTNLDADTQILPVNGTREALFAFAQCVIKREDNPVIMMPNPFYQIYEGAAYLAGAEPYYMNTMQETDFLPDFASVPEDIWQRCQLIYLCSPGNPTGAVISIEQMQQLIELADKYDFVIASDECYSELYYDDEKPPAGLLQAAVEAGRNDFRRCIVFHSLSKRSNAPGLRSGFVAGDAEIMQAFFRYRTYHGCAMPPAHQFASIAAWSDEAHVIENRALYREKFRAVHAILNPVMPVQIPEGSFYLWPETPISDTDFAQQLFAQQNITVLPGSYLSRTPPGQPNPGEYRIRMALVAPLEDCIDAAERIRDFINSL
jgi:N-succinyldiaminopimelate aminotransferase